MKYFVIAAVIFVVLIIVIYLGWTLSIFGAMIAPHNEKMVRGATMENLIETPVLSKQGKIIGVHVRFTMTFPKGLPFEMSAVQYTGELEPDIVNFDQINPGSIDLETGKELLSGWLRGGKSYEFSMTLSPGFLNEFELKEGTAVDEPLFWFSTAEKEREFIMTSKTPVPIIIRVFGNPNTLKTRPYLMRDFYDAAIAGGQKDEGIPKPTN